MIRPGGLLLFESGTGMNISDGVAFRCNNAGINCIVFMLSDPTERNEARVPNDARNASDFFAFIASLARGRTIGAREPAEDTLQIIRYSATGAGGTLTYTVTSDTPEPTTLLPFGSGLCLMAIWRIVSQKAPSASNEKKALGDRLHIMLASEPHTASANKHRRGFSYVLCLANVELRRGYTPGHGTASQSQSSPKPRLFLAAMALCSLKCVNCHCFRPCTPERTLA
jgi:hypothetical protein